MRTNKINLGLTVLFLLAICVMPAYSAAVDKNTLPEVKFKAGELLIKFKLNVSETVKENIHRKYGSKKIKEFSDLRIQHVQLKKELNVGEAIKLYKADQNIEYAEPNFIVKAVAVPNDPYFSNLWGLYNYGQTGGASGADIRATLAWDLTTGSSNVVVAVIDTGIDYSHSDLNANMWVNTGEVQGNGLDDDGNGYIDDMYGFNVLTGSGNINIMDDNGHGTHVAGTIGAVGNNGVGVVGVNWNVKIMGCKFLDSSGYGSHADAIQCLEYVRAMKTRGLNIVATNNSWGCSGNCSSQALSDAIDAQREILFIAAAGNNGTNNDTMYFYPANYSLPNIISVAATDSHDGKAGFSNQGRRTVHIGAPGVDIFNTLPAQNIWGILGGYGLLSGTSMATPHVTGLAALIKSLDTSSDWKKIKNLILSGGDNTTSMDGTTITGKRINAYSSLTCGNSPVFSVLQYPSFITVGTPASLSVLSINCGSPAGPATVTTASGEVINLYDNGTVPDLAAGDGVFTGIWVPAHEGEVLIFSSPSGTETITYTAPTPNPNPLFTFTGQVTYVDDMFGSLHGAVSIGDVVTGSFTYDFNTPDSNTDPTVADYWHYSAPNGVSVAVKGLTFKTDPANTQFLAEVINDHQVCYSTGCVLEDAFVLHSYKNIFSVPMDMTHIAWQLDDPSATALSNTALPRFFNLSSWMQDFGLTIDGSNVFTPERYFIRVKVNDVQGSDTTPPTGSIVINGDAAYTNNTYATLTLSASDANGVAQMQFSNDNITWSTPEPYATTKTWMLTSGDGIKTVSVKFKDNTGNWSTAYNDSIQLDSAPPTGSIVINGDAAYTNNTYATLTLSASDANGVAQMQFSNDNITWSTPEPYATTKAWMLTSGDGTKTVSVKFKDNTGKWSTAYSDSIQLDSTPPTGSITINLNAEITYTASVVLTLSCTDSVSGCIEMQFSNDRASWSNPEPYTTTRSWTLTSGDGARSVYVKFRDNAGGWSYDYGDSITLSTSKSDLAIQSMGAPVSASAGTSITVNETTINAGPGISGSSMTKFYFSNDAVLNAGDILLGSTNVPLLIAGSSSVGIVSLTIPAVTRTGTYYIIAVADADNAVPEGNENNNMLSKSIRIKK